MILHRVPEVLAEAVHLKLYMDKGLLIKGEHVWPAKDLFELGCRMFLLAWGSGNTARMTIFVT